MFPVSMRAMLLLTCLLAGCTGFHPLRRTADQDAAVATDASSVREPVPVIWSPKWQVIGESVQGRPLRMAQLGRGPRRVLWVGGIHGDEREGRISTAELPRALMMTPGALEQITLTILEDVNPDGTALHTRSNAHGIDLNRNYPAANFKPDHRYGRSPLDQPEAKALHDLILDERPHLVIVAHSWHDDHFINFDGPAEQLAARFSQLSGYRVKESDDIAPTPGSLGSWVGKTLHIPILTLEYHRGREPWAAWNDTKAAILSVVLSG
jgi:murein peptide amidase A